MFGNHSWGLVLSGGGGKGAYQAGVLKAIQEANANIIAVAGASVGALNAAMFATYPVNSMVQIWKSISSEIALSQEHLGDLIRANAIPSLMRKSKITCYANGYNILTGKTEYYCLNEHHDEEIVKLLLASAAMPIVYPPVTFKGNLYWDGGILDNTPVEILYQKGFRNIIVVYLSPDVKEEVYKDTNMIYFAPSEKWGFLDGTLNFNYKDIRAKIDLGYREARKKILGMKK